MISNLLEVSIKDNKAAVSAVDDRYTTTRNEKFVCAAFKGWTTLHPCIGARALSGKLGFHAIVYPQMDTYTTALGLIHDLEIYYKIADQIEDNIKTCAIFFSEEETITQSQFTRKYWDFVQILHDVDSCIFPYDPKVSAKPDEKNFELSLCGRAVFTTTLNRGSPRTARTFIYPTWIMNQIQQFDLLRAEDRFKQWQKNIRGQDSILDPSGTSNPILTDHGYESAASQLAGADVQPGETYFTPNTSTSQAGAAKKRVLSALQNEGADNKIIDWFEKRSHV